MKNLPGFLFLVCGACIRLNGTLRKAICPKFGIIGEDSEP